MNTGNLSPRRRRRRFLIGYDEAELPVKREPEEDIKDYAETTMNELLGWYGYEKVDSRDTQGLNLTHFASNSEDNKNPSVSGTPSSSGVEGSDVSEDENADGPPSRLRSDSASPGPDVSSTASDEVARQQQHMVSALSSVTKHPGAPDSPNLPPGCIVCAWCQKVGMKLFTLKTPNGCKAFCSELCFTQCRRASFKKNKICDWCKHVRHTVNYVDFQDGEQQLQFCSDKCLNQYKMNIFCKETQAHLQMHTHLKEAACKMKASGSVNLITPELWLRDCKINGMPTSPTGANDSMDDINSDENVSAIPSPGPVMESSRPSSPISAEKKEQTQDLSAPTKEKEKSSKKLSKVSPKKSVSDSKLSHSNKHHRDKKVNGLQNSDAPTLSRQSPIQASPSSHSSRNSHLTNGTPSLLSPPPLGLPRPPHHVGSFPFRHGPPPVPSSLGIGGIDPGRQPFMHPNMIPPPFQFFAQQQMEHFLRSQRGLDLRSKAPPPHIPIPPWVVPPFPPMHPHPPQSSLQPPIPPQSPSLPQSSPLTTRTYHHHHSVSHKISSHHSKHKQSKRSSVHSTTGNVPPATVNSPVQDSSVQLHPPLVPPVTVMVPFPLIIPIPLPIPVPIPIPPDVMEKYKSKQKELNEKHHTKNIPSSSFRKRKLSSESLKSKKSRIHALHNTSILNTPLIAEAGNGSPEIRPSVSYYDQLENLSFRMSESPSVDCRDSSKRPKTNNDINVESRSYSPLSEAFSSNDDDDDIRKTLKNGEIDSYSNINFTAYGFALARSSPVTPQVNDLIPMSSSVEYQKSPSPTNLSIREKQHVSVASSTINFKKKHLREQLSLMT